MFRLFKPECYVSNQDEFDVEYGDIIDNFMCNPDFAESRSGLKFFDWSSTSYAQGVLARPPYQSATLKVKNPPAERVVLD